MRGIAKVVGPRAVRLPAGSAAVVEAVAWNRKGDSDPPILVAPSTYPLLDRVLVVRTLCSLRAGRVPVRVVSLGAEDIWLKPRTRIGIMHRVDDIQPAYVQVDFQRVTSSEKQISIKEKSDQLGDITDDVIEESSIPVDLFGSDCTPDQRARLVKVFWKHRDLSASGDDDLGYTDRVRHQIPTVDEVPVHLALRSIPPTQYEEVKRHIRKLLDAKVIKESYSPYAPPIVLVRMKNGSLRMCVDYRKHYSKTIKDAFPLPRFDESFSALKGANWFSSLDLASGYNQVAMDEKDRHKTASTTSFGLYEFERTPFGLCNAPATFQRLMQGCLADMLIEILLLF